MTMKSLGDAFRLRNHTTKNLEADPPRLPLSTQRGVWLTDQASSPERGTDVLLALGAVDALEVRDGEVRPGRAVELRQVLLTPRATPVEPVGGVFA
jgi:hypothetical protein